MNKYVKRSLQIGVPLALAAWIIIPRIGGDGVQSKQNTPGNMGKGRLPVTGIIAKNSVVAAGFPVNGSLLQTDYNMLEADIELLKVKISRTEIRAPFDGVMGFRYVSEGSYVQPSSQIARIVDNSTLKYEFNIPEKYADNNLKGQEVFFKVTGNDKLYSAKVYAVDPFIDVKTRMILLRARFRNTNGELMPGMFAKGNLVVGGKTEFIAVPTEAVVPEMDGKRMWIVKNGKALSVPVETESRDEKNVEVTSGISVGDTILTGGLMQLRDGMAVEVKMKR